RAVEHATARIDELDVLHFGRVRRALKHHVFEEMREPAAALRLEPKADLIVDANGNDGSCRVRNDDDLKAIGQLGMFHRYVQSTHAGLPKALTLDLRAAEIFSSSASILSGSASSTRATR